MLPGASGLGRYQPTIRLYAMVKLAYSYLQRLTWHIRMESFLHFSHTNEGEEMHVLEQDEKQIWT
jgi:hypothetical protein